MKYRSVLFLPIFFFFISNNLVSQNFKGVVSDKDGKPIPGATIFITEISQGLLSNEDGQYQTTLKSGNYTVEYKCLGFKSSTKKIQLSGSDIITESIILQENPFELGEIVVENKEDPAYKIMRKAIAKAPEYAKSVKSYKAEAYIKGNMQLLKISKMVDKMATKEDGVKMSELTNQLFVQESFNEIEFTYPDKYKQTVKAFSSSVPDDYDAQDPIRLMGGSLYQPNFYGLISPLDKKSFSFYRFRYEGYSEENGINVNKIKIIPKVKDPELMSGYLYIADDTWHIVSADIKCKRYMTREDFTITYQEVQKNIFLPITFQTRIDIDVLGNWVIYNYFSSLKYSDIEKTDGDLKPASKNKKREFEITRDSLYRIESDSLATKRDSLYWSQIRFIPIDSLEVDSYLKKDSIQLRIDSMRKKHHNTKFSWGSILSGGKIGGDSTLLSFRYDGLLLAAPEYNFVDGVWLGQKFDVSTRLNDYNRLKISPYIYYAQARKVIIGGGNIELKYAPSRLGKLEISGGSTTIDFNPLGILRLNNSFSSLFWAKNYNFFYEKQSVSINNIIDLANGLRLSTGIEVAKRTGMANRTDYTWGHRSKIKENPFAGERFDKTAYSVVLQYAPYSYYSMKGCKKRYEKITSPIFQISYSEALSGWQTNNSRYKKLQGSVSQYIRAGHFSTIDYSIGGGGFIGKNKNMHFADYQQFNTSNILYSFKSIFDTFVMLDNYEASTNRYWITGTINYTDKYILLKRLPFLQGKLFNESLHLKGLYTPDMKLYTEVGYSLNLFRTINAGVFVSFKKTDFQSFGVRLSTDLRILKFLND